MKPANIDEFYYSTAEILTHLYVAFPVRQILLVEDISGPIKWDMTGLPDRKSKACFEAMIWHSEHDLLTFRSVEPRDIGVEGAVLTQRAFVLLNGLITWESGGSMSRIDAMIEARRQRAYDDLGTVVHDLLRANCQWGAPVNTPRLVKAPPIAVGTEEA
jgi:hypothetical protein